MELAAVAAALLPQRDFVYPPALTSRWVYPRLTGAQTQDAMPASTRQQAEDEERAATAVALPTAEGGRAEVS